MLRQGQAGHLRIHGAAFTSVIADKIHLVDTFYINIVLFPSRRRDYITQELSNAKEQAAVPPIQAVAKEGKHDGMGELDANIAQLWKTEAQQWGSFYSQKRPPGADPFSSQRSCWQKPRSKCDVTEYGDR